MAHTTICHQFSASVLGVPRAHGLLAPNSEVGFALRSNIPLLWIDTETKLISNLSHPGCFAEFRHQGKEERQGNEQQLLQIQRSQDRSSGCIVEMGLWLSLMGVEITCWGNRQDSSSSDNLMLQVSLLEPDWKPKRIDICRERRVDLIIAMV